MGSCRLQVLGEGIPAMKFRESGGGLVPDEDAAGMVIDRPQQLLWGCGYDKNNSPCHPCRCQPAACGAGPPQERKKSGENEGADVGVAAWGSRSARAEATNCPGRTRCRLLLSTGLRWRGARGLGARWRQGRLASEASTLAGGDSLGFCWSRVYPSAVLPWGHQTMEPWSMGIGEEQGTKIIT